MVIVKILFKHPAALIARFAGFSFLVCLLAACQHPDNKKIPSAISSQAIALKNIVNTDTSTRSIHVFVALCDNKYQGIVPVPAKIGNGQDAELNLYWGGDYGVRTYFKRSKEWQLVKKIKANGVLLQRLIFKHKTANYYLIADAYNGQYIKQTTVDFLHSCAGQLKDTLHINQQVVGIDGNARLLAYIGHDGLMDFKLSPNFKNSDNKTRDCIILACISKTYFKSFIVASKAYPLVWTTGLMCPEAYTLHDALSAYIKNEPHKKIRASAAAAYNKYQKSGLTFANSLLVQGY